MAGGRPTKLTDEVCDDIVKNIKEGIPPATAAELAGISKKTYYNWINRGKASKRKNKFTEFLRKVDGACAFASKELLREILKSKDWKAKKYVLGFFDSDYNTPDKVEVKADVTTEGTVTIFNPTTQDKILEEEGYNEDTGGS